MAELSERERRAVAYSLRNPRGRYSSSRAAQLSGVPQRTIYDWLHKGIYPTDYPDARPATWSYRDLVLLRLLAWLRQGRMQRPLAAEKVASVRTQLSRGLDIQRIHATRSEVLISGDPDTRYEDDSERLLPFEDFYQLLNTFDVLEPVEELRPGSRGDVWAPDLVTPSLHSTISPWVMAGEPCVKNSRIPTATLFALRTERNLPVELIVRLYPGLDQLAVEDVTNLERRLRRDDESATV